MTEQADPTEFQIPLVRWEDFVERFDKLNRRAKRLGTQPCAYAVLGERVVKRTISYRVEGEEISKEIDVRVRVVTVTGLAPQLAGWTLAGRLENVGTAAKPAQLIHVVPGFDGKVDQRFRALADTCEHCHTKRRRTDIFLVANAETGEQKAVGRTCLADFTGINSPEHAASVCSWLVQVRDLCEDRGWYAAHDEIIPCRAILAIASAAIRRFGWVSRARAEQGAGMATGDIVREYLRGTGKSAAELRESVGKPTDDDHAEAARVISWVGTIEAKSDYERNLVALVVDDLARIQHVALIASAIASYQRAQNRLREAETRRERDLHSTHQGEQKQRLRDLAVTVDYVRSFDGHYGPTTLIKFRDAAGNIYSWFASGDHRLEHGAAVTITGTVKGHKEFRDIKETQLSRVVYR